MPGDPSVDPNDGEEIGNGATDGEGTDSDGPDGEGADSDVPDGEESEGSLGEASVRAVADGYEALSRAADDELSKTVSPWGDSHFQRHYAWPGVRDALPAIDGERVLLAGCGRGDHVDAFASDGATVTGVDVSANAVAKARDRNPEVAFAVCDLTAGIPFDDASFDVICTNLVLSHVPDLDPVLESFERVLAPGGVAVAGMIHPQYQRTHWELESYAESTSRVVDWGVATLTSHYRPTSTIVQAFLDAGFSLERVAEPTPRESYRDANPERYAAAMREPQVLVIRARVNE